MSGITIRKLEVDLDQAFPRHWHSGCAFRTRFFNALSMSFPVGEQFFIDSVRDALALLPEGTKHQQLRADAAQFNGQEATHRYVHARYNQQLERQGLVNRWQHWATWRIDVAQRHQVHPLHMLAATAAYEHCTAVFADGTLRNPIWLADATPPMCTLWTWHAAEETEHRAVAFDLLRALGGNYRLRTLWFVYVLLTVTLEASLQTMLNLWHDASLFKPRTWAGALSFLCGRQGVLWRCTGPMLRYFKPGFHPHQDTAQPTASALAAQWLEANAAQFRVVR